MRIPRPLSSLAWIVAPILALAFFFWIDSIRIRHVGEITRLAGGTDMAIDAASPTGYVGGVRALIAPAHNNESYQWIAQTQQMLAQGEWRLRHADYDNAPTGRSIRSPSPYRWWLGVVAWCDHVLSGRPLGLAVEHAALYAEPALQLLLLLGLVVFITRTFGPFPAAWVSLGIVFLFPFAGSFLPGVPDEHGWALALVMGSILPLLAAIRTGNDVGATQGFLRADTGPDAAIKTARTIRRWFCGAGIAGACGLWINVASTVPMLGGVAVGGLFAAALARRKAPNLSAIPSALPQPVLSWRMWALSGAGTILLAYLLEYFPSHMGEFHLEEIHPLYGLAWLGGGELLTRADRRLRGERETTNVRNRVIRALAILALASLPTAMLLAHSRGFLADDFLSSRLSNLPDAADAANLWAWMVRDGITPMLAATCVPLLLLVPAGWILARRETSEAQRATIALAVGPVVVALAFACFQLRWWNVLDCALLVMLVPLTAKWATSAVRWSQQRLWWSGALVLVLIPGAWVLWSERPVDGSTAITAMEVESLIERDLAHWLAQQAGPKRAVVLASPSLTTTLYFHGGLRGLGTPYRDNKAGLAAAIRIASATSQDEAETLSRKRNVAYIVLASWDPALDNYARRAAGEKGDSALFPLLARWKPPRWLQPVPYPLPRIAGFEGQSVAIFKVVEVQENVTALSHLAAYFVEMGRLDLAEAVGATLQHMFPADLRALIARAQIAFAQDQTSAPSHLIGDIVNILKRGDDRALAWDQRVSLAIVLAQAKHFDQARVQMQRCIAEVDEPRLRSLTAVSLYRFQVLGKAFGLTIPDPHLRDVARSLVLPELRAEL